jgi:hypothetical protein
VSGGGYSLQLVVGLVVLAAVIAYLGDYLGWRLGRRRISLLGLRPRQTARLITVVAGVLITGVTVAVTAALLPEVRAALFQVAYLRQQAATLESQNRTLAEAVKAAQADFQAAEAQLESARKETESAKAQRAEAVRSAEQARAVLARANRELKDRQARLRATEDKLRRTEAGYQQAKEDLKQAQQHLAQARGDVEGAKEEVKRAVATVSSYEEELARLRVDTQRYRDEVDRLLVTIRDVSAVLEAIGSGEVIYMVGEELARAVIAKGLSGEQIRAQLAPLLRQAEQAALERGAARAQGGEVLVPFVPGMQSPSFEPVLAALAAEIRRSGDETVAQVYAKANAWRGGQVIVDLRAFRNRLILRAGEVIAQRTLDPAASAQALAEGAVRLLEEARAKVRDLGLMPGPKGEFIEMPLERILAALLLVRQEKGPVLLSLEATGDTWTGDRLQAEFKVRAGG